MSNSVRQFTIDSDDDGIRVDRWFQRHLPDIGFSMVSRWARTGQLRVDGGRVAPGDRLATGQTIRIPPGNAAPQGKGRTRPPRELSDAERASAEAMLIHRDRAALIINKPPGLATQGGSKTYTHVDGLLDAYAGEGEPRPRLVHRLDKDTSGVLLVARTPGSAAYFSRRFSGRSAKKTYWALLVGVPDIPQGQIDLPLAKQPGTGGEKMHVDEEGGQLARTRYRIIERAGKRACWVELQPLTGRTHQLRVHMAAIGHPIVGDGKYGGPDSYLTGEISRKMHLHARHLRIDHPDGDPLDISAPLPEHFAETMAHLGFDLDAGDVPFDPNPPPPTREDRKAKARAHAKQVRKARRGERRARAGGPSDASRPTRKPRKAAKPKSAKTNTARKPSGPKRTGR